jgi:CBS domain containing-hemolysin-like protein
MALGDDDSSILSLSFASFTTSSTPKTTRSTQDTIGVTASVKEPQSHEDEEILRLRDALILLESLGIPRDFICHPFSNDYEPLLVHCSSSSDTVDEPKNRMRHPFLRKTEELGTDSNNKKKDDGNDVNDEEPHDWVFLATHAFLALLCVCTAALAAGLTMGLLSLDPLLLLIKMRAGATKLEQDQAASLLPLVKQHHLLLVTLLLLNSIANEALPLFLEVLVSPVVAVVLSVTLVLFFGEIIPSAVFTGPNKIAIASRLTPVVKTVMCLLYPLAYPIAKLLDHVLHEGDDSDGSGGGGGGSSDSAFNRGELSALVRIQYEERLASKTQRRKERQTAAASGGSCHDPRHAAQQQQQRQSSFHDLSFHPNHVGGLDFTSSIRSSTRDIRSEVRATKRQISRRSFSTFADDDNGQEDGSVLVREAGFMFLADPSTGHRHSSGRERRSDGDPRTAYSFERLPSIHMDEVAMVEGALQMKTKMAFDVLTPLHRVFSVPLSMILDEHNVVRIYSSGFSRVPVYDDITTTATTTITTASSSPSSIHSQKKKQQLQTTPTLKTAIRGILMTRQLMVINSEEERPLATVPLLIPLCVSPKLNLVDLLNLFQKGTVGHMALVCARPQVASDAFAAGIALPEAAGFIGYVYHFRLWSW